MQKSLPIKVFYSRLTGRFYASKHYKADGKGHVVITGKKYDVTDDIGSIITAFNIEFTPQTPAEAKSNEG